MIGVVVLSGILVNDGIIMVDFINQQRRIHGLPLREAIIEGAAARLRPILMTTATTVLGLLPLALGFGEGSQLQAPMAITIIGGQITGTLLLLLAIPSIYKVLTREAAVSEGAGLVAAGGVAYAVSGGQTAGKSLAGQHSARTGALEKSNGDRERSLVPLVLRMVLVLILAAVILVLFRISGQELMMVIH
jgi:hydrophobic/amphiphilic exporter-1 (mainly G- bacteria), HAE1 family